jgi:3-deoxy-manno-octulosonate cytidylyltransferase (CMP-KDO synthetase)
MNLIPPCYGIIPARYASTRFPGKPLALIKGKPMFWHVYQRASQCPELQKVIVATDDARIFQAATDLGVPVVMTRPDHPSGTDRVLEAARVAKLPADAIVVNIQGDEPLLQPVMLSELIVPFKAPEIQVTTLAHEIDRDRAQISDQVKVVFAAGGDALYFSRAPIPYSRDNINCVYYGHIGIYAYRMNALIRFADLSPSRLEGIEKLEQLRLLENRIPVHVRVTTYRSTSVDWPEDIEKVVHLMDGKG